MPKYKSDVNKFAQPSFDQIRNGKNAPPVIPEINPYSHPKLKDANNGKIIDHGILIVIWSKTTLKLYGESIKHKIPSKIEIHILFHPE